MQITIPYETETGTAHMTVDRSSYIALTNDIFRTLIPGGPIRGIPGQAVVTRGVADLGHRFVTAVGEAIIDFDDFTEDNDPYGEHDFGVVEVEGEQVFWKIDYYADDTCTLGSDDPADCTQTYRVMTVMLAEEY